MTLDKEETLISYRQAADKYEQVFILADLNCCAPAQIAAALDEWGALSEAGLRVRQFPNRYNPVEPADKALQRRKATQSYRDVMDTVAARALFDKGLSDTEIAMHLSVPVYRIKQWRNAEQLRRPSASPWRKQHTVNLEEAKQMIKKEDAPAEAVPETQAAPQPEPAEAPAQAEPVKALTLGDFKSALTSFIPALLNNAELYVNGQPLLDLDGFTVSTGSSSWRIDLNLRTGKR